MRKYLLFIGVALVMAIAAYSCQDAAEGDIASREDFIDYLEQEVEDQHIPALSVVIFNEEGSLFEYYLGQSDVELGLPLTSTDVFLLASVSKVVTATALLQLHDQGLFDLDDSINDHLPFAVTIPGYTSPITFRMLLTHTSAIADGMILDEHYYYGEDSPISLAYFFQNYLTQNGVYYDAEDNFNDHAPGTKYDYSNAGSALIGLLVEQISGQPFDQYCDRMIFEPLGMRNTFWRLDAALQAPNHVVQPYTYESGGFDRIGHYTFTDYPNGGLRSSGVDLTRFFGALMNGGQGPTNEVLKPETVEAMMTPQVPDLEPSVGLHMFLLDPGSGIWGHDGGEQGVTTIVGFSPETKVGVIALSNEGNVDMEDIFATAYDFGLTL